MGNRRLLRFFTRLLHARQRKKYNGEPYINHCIEVANMADQYIGIYAYEVGLCHDLLEDTICTPRMLDKVLWLCGYKKEKRNWIVGSVIDLTDIYTKENFPNLNRKARKKLEAERQSKADYLVQSVKYCDIINNTSNIVKYDPEFAVIYLEEKKFLLDLCDKGHAGLRSLAYDHCVIV